MAVSASPSQQSTPKLELSKESFLKSVKTSKNCKNLAQVATASSLGESDSLSVELLRSEYLQRKVDRGIRELEQGSHLPDKESHKIKSGSGIDVVVKHRVHWPHEAILGGKNQQQVNYHQLSLTQWVQGFTKSN